MYLEAYNRNPVTLPDSAQRKHDFTGKIKNISKKIQQERKFLLNCYIRDYGTDLPDNFYLRILPMYGKM